jgi:hypothetical protein
LSAATTVDARDSKLNAHSSAREHVDQRVYAEQVDLATNEIAYPRLGNSKEVCRRTLRQFARPDKTPYFHHQLSAKPQALSLLRSEANISEHIPRRLLKLHRHISRGIRNLGLYKFLYGVQRSFLVSATCVFWCFAARVFDESFFMTVFSATVMLLLMMRGMARKCWRQNDEGP